MGLSTTKVAKPPALIEPADRCTAVLKKPLHTNIAVEMDEFDHVQVQDKLHIIISVKDFRAILQHAQLTSGELTTIYSNPGRPMRLSYGVDGILCEFILMTVGEKDAVTQKHKNLRANAPKAVRPELDAGSHRGSYVAKDQQPAPPEPASAPPAPPQQKIPARPRQPAFEIRPQPMPPPATAQSDSLFVGQADDDEQWEPVNPEEDEEEEENARLEWDATTEPVLLSLPLSYPASLLTRSDRTHRLCALVVIFQDRPRFQMRSRTALPLDLNRHSGCLRYAPSHSLLLAVTDWSRSAGSVCFLVNCTNVVTAVAVYRDTRRFGGC